MVNAPFVFRCRLARHHSRGPLKGFHQPIRMAADSRPPAPPWSNTSHGRVFARLIKVSSEVDHQTYPRQYSNVD